MHHTTCPELGEVAMLGGAGGHECDEGCRNQVGTMAADIRATRRAQGFMSSNTIPGSLIKLFNDLLDDMDRYRKKDKGAVGHLDHCSVAEHRGAIMVDTNRSS
ncbi:hypothetical protein RRG08_020127 [Elysia crispata]|uniref:Uncharacterized protein n=1 Tax=Elysia crispata TaxID=231223 RepID=A0AAE1A596_9GAST|nr:hypothetical protein RRG08_020127 [Elysia crispata]